jgi:GDPmannose 4,6-dehydratase
MKTALITGITGQDGSYLAELLLKKRYKVHGIVRPETNEDADHKLKNIEKIVKSLHLHVSSLEDLNNLSKIFEDVKPDECYHLASPSFVPHTFAGDSSFIDLNLNCTNHLLSLIEKIKPDCRFFFAASSEVFGFTKEDPQDENTPFQPRSLYGLSKTNGMFITKYFREIKKIHASSGILYNHESPRRGYQFLTRKITREVAEIAITRIGKLILGNTNGKRDWGYAPDYVDAMWRILQNDRGGDFVIATGELHTVQEVINYAFQAANLEPEKYLEVNPKIDRYDEGNSLCGNPQKIENILNWKETRSLQSIIKEMFDSDKSELELMLK